MLDWLGPVLDQANHQLGHYTPVRAIIFGVGCSAVFTQIIKKTAAFGDFGDTLHRWSTRVVAFLLAALPCWLLWPEPGLPAVVVSGALGFVTPALYTLIVRIAVHFWPWLEPQVSARPTVVQPPPQEKPS